MITNYVKVNRKYKETLLTQRIFQIMDLRIWFWEPSSENFKDKFKIYGNEYILKKANNHWAKIRNKISVAPYKFTMFFYIEIYKNIKMNNEYLKWTFIP